jgi:hypothetical protein
MLAVAGRDVAVPVISNSMFQISTLRCPHYKDATPFSGVPMMLCAQRPTKIRQCGKAGGSNWQMGFNFARPR